METLYLKIARRFGILDKPNHRSTHTVSIVTGAGIVFIIAIFFHVFLFGFQYRYFLIGLLACGSISFLDDLYPLNYKIRIIFHFLSAGLLFYEPGLNQIPVCQALIGLIFIVGIMNAVNFMDGINGMTGTYALVNLITLWYLNESGKQFIESSLILAVMLSAMAFNFYNFRSQARCFAGDVGSIGMAFILIFFISRLIVVSWNPTYILLLLIYGLDTVTTIAFKLIRKENIFKAHRNYYFQYLVDEKKIPHLYVSSVYALVQVLFNLLLILSPPFSWKIAFTIASFTTCLFIVLRFKTEGKKRLMEVIPSPSSPLPPTPL